MRTGKTRRAKIRVKVFTSERVEHPQKRCQRALITSTSARQKALDVRRPGQHSGPRTPGVGDLPEPI